MRVSPNKMPSRRRSAAPQDERIAAGKHRIVQISRTGGRKLFDTERRELFLEWFAATCNVKLSAAKAGVAYQTVFKHRMKDQAFADAWDRALQQGYARLEARLLQEACPLSPTPLPQKGEGLEDDLEVRVGLDDPEVEAAFDPQLALAILREQKRNVHGHTPKLQRTGARTATSKEVADALAKRLKAFAMRVSKAPPTADASGEDGE